MSSLRLGRIPSYRSVRRPIVLPTQEQHRHLHLLRLRRMVRRTPGENYKDLKVNDDLHFYEEHFQLKFQLLVLWLLESKDYSNKSS